METPIEKARRLWKEAKARAVANIPVRKRCSGKPGDRHKEQIATDLRDSEIKCPVCKGTMNEFDTIL